MSDLLYLYPKVKTGAFLGLMGLCAVVLIFIAAVIHHGELQAGQLSQDMKNSESDVSESKTRPLVELWVPSHSTKQPSVLDTLFDRLIPKSNPSDK